MADSIRAPLVKWAGGLLSRHGALTGDRNCCCLCPPTNSYQWNILTSDVDLGPVGGIAGVFAMFKSIGPQSGREPPLTASEWELRLMLVEQNGAGGSGCLNLFFAWQTCNNIDQMGAGVEDAVLVLLDELNAAVGPDNFVEIYGDGSHVDLPNGISDDALADLGWHAYGDICDDVELDGVYFRYDNLQLKCKCPDGSPAV